MQPQHTQPNAPARVLIVDDDVALTQLLAHVLAADHVAADVAEDARHGLELARNQRPAVIVVDLHLPDLDGYAFIAACRAIPGCAEVPIFLASAEGDIRGMRQRLDGMGVVLIMRKPFDLDTLIAAIRGAVRSHGGYTPTPLEDTRGESARDRG